MFLTNLKLETKFYFKNPKSILKVVYLTPTSGSRMSAKLTFLVIDMKSICKHVSKAGEKHLFII